MLVDSNEDMPDGIERLERMFWRDERTMNEIERINSNHQQLQNKA